MKNVLNYFQMLTALTIPNKRCVRQWLWARQCLWARQWLWQWLSLVRQELGIRQGLGITLLMFASISHGLPEDSQQPIHIRSNSAIKDDKKGLTIYQGDVVMSQGSLNIQADKITIYSKNDKVTKIIAKGSPARFKQQPEEDQGDVIAKASVVEYRITQETISLVGNASLDQDGSTITGNQINYDINASRVEARSSADSGPIQVVIPANSLTPKKPVPKKK